MSPTLNALLERANRLQVEATKPGRRALESLLRVGDEVLARHGYQGTRVDNLVEAAGISRGAFYRYFENSDDFVRIVAVKAVNDVSLAMADLPASPDRPTLRRWLRRYNTVHADSGIMIRIWLEAVDEAEHGDRAAMLDVGRRRMARLLEGRSFGDPDIDAVGLFAAAEVFGSRHRSEDEVEAALAVIGRGFMGKDA